MKERKLNKTYHLCMVCERVKWKMRHRTPTVPIPKLTRAQQAAAHRIASTKRRRHRRDMRKNPLYRFIWTELEVGYIKAMNLAVLGVEDPAEFKGLKDLDVQSFLGFMENIDFTYTGEKTNETNASPLGKSSEDGGGHSA